MSDHGAPERIPHREIGKEQQLFYPNIADNKLMFHGTRTQESRDSILTEGLLPPPLTTVSQDTLARRMSFCDYERYGGHGYIFAFRPEENEIVDFNAQYAGTLKIDRYKGKIPAERIIFYVNGNQASSSTRQMFTMVREALQTFATSGYNPTTLQTDVRSLIEYASQFIKDQGVFIDHTPSPEEIDQLSQEIVWNELCGRITHISNDTEYLGGYIKDILKNNPNISYSQIETLMGERLRYDIPNLDAFLDQLQIIFQLPQVQGLGFEGFNYDYYGTLEPLQQQLKALQAEHISRQQEQAKQATVEDTQHNEGTLKQLLDRLKRK